MTILDELLILLDDLGEADPESVRSYCNHVSRQIVFSSLGRLVNRGWVDKRSKRQETVYSVTIHGVNELNRTLDVIRDDTPFSWDYRWRMVIFDIPEVKRKVRDSFRSSLREEGFGMLKSSIWLSPRDKKEFVRRIAKRLNLGDSVTLLETTEMTDIYQSIQLAQQSWDWSVIEKNYRGFIHTAERELVRFKRKDPTTRFRAKRLVYRYAEIVKSDPSLPLEISPVANLARKARDVYAKIRPYCLTSEPILPTQP